MMAHPGSLSAQRATMAATSALRSLSGCALCDFGGRRSEGGLIRGA
eukprot:CAMPEP_0117562672 /NCGR_PEP_ID=MMETSP0784-20121206/55080_1 /TAXON_ID=39447 /ORGANISM="" /LENGTH=45 /DNA_ID= /DNA_START= /DNA_END= /DNA_ORIENTATION=